MGLFAFLGYNDRCMLGKLAIGLASLIIGVKHLHGGLSELQGLVLERRKAKRTALQQHQAKTLKGQKRGKGRRPDQRKALPAQGLGRIAAPKTGKQVLGKDMSMTLHQINGIEDRIKFIQERISKGKVDPSVYEFTRKAVSKKCGDKWCIEEKDNIGEAKAVFDAIRKNVRYTSDILGIDTYQHPKHTLGLKSGDCDDASGLVCATMLSLGIPCRLVVIKTKGSPDWSHIYAEAGFPRANPTRWIAMDASVPKPFGWAAPSSMVDATRRFSAQ